MAGGTKVADTFVGMSLDIGEYLRGIKQAKTEALSLGQQIKAALAGKSFGGTSGIAGLIEDLKRGGNLFTSLKRNLPGIGRDLAGLSVKGLTSGLQTVGSLGTRVFGTLRTLASNVFKGFAVGLGIGAFLSLEQVIARLVKAIPDLVAKGRDYANEVDQIVDVTGAATERASLLISTLKFLGQDVSTVYIRMGQLSKSVHEQEQELNTLGVTTRDVNGDFLNQVELLFNIQSAFSKLPDGVKKARLEVLLFGGRGGLGQLVDFMALTDEQLTVLGEHFEEQGLIISDEERKVGEAALRAGKDIDNAFTGLAAQLFNIVGPQIVAFLSSIATAITERAEEIADFVASVVNTLLGLFQGLTGIAPEFTSVATRISRMGAASSETSFRLSEMETDLGKLKDQLKNAGGQASTFNDGIAAGVKALDDQQKAIDRSIGRINRLADASLDAYRKINDVLQTKIDLETEAFDAEERRIGREQNVADQLRDQAQAYIDLREAQAQYNKDKAEGADQGTLDSDIVAIADAAQKVRDVQEDIANTARKTAREDRQAQIEGVKEYVKGVEEIVLNSENKKAALNTLTKRKAKLEEQIAAAEAKGNAQEVLDLRVRLAAVEAGIIEEGKQIKAGVEVDELTARKASLEEQKEALLAARITEGQINRRAVEEAIRVKEAEIKKEKERIAVVLKNSQDERAAALELSGDYKRHFGEGGVVPKAFEESRLAGLAAAEGIKKAFGDLATFLFGVEKEGPTTGGGTGFRTGGFLGMLGGITDAFGTIASGVSDILSGMTQFKPKDIGLGIAAAGVFFKSPQMILAGLALYGIGVGVEAAEKVRGGAEAGDFNEIFGLPPKGKPTEGLEAERARRIVSDISREPPNEPYYGNPARIHDGLPPETNAQTIARLTAEIKANKFSNHGFELGGRVPGPSGKPVPTIVHGGEVVLPEPAVREIERLDRSVTARETVREIITKIVQSFIHDTPIGQPIPAFAMGGIIPGERGQAVPILGHAQEYVAPVDLTEKLTRYFDRPMMPSIEMAAPQFTGFGAPIEIHVHIDNGEQLTRMFGGARFIDYIDEKLDRKSRR